MVTVCRYIISVNDDHVVSVLPYISDTGGKAPESCIFSLLLSIAALLGELTNSAAPQPAHGINIPLLLLCLVGSIATLKFLLYHQQHRYDFSPLYSWLNGLLYVCGLLAALGLLIVGCFQVSPSLPLY